MQLPQPLIDAKRQGHPLTSSQIDSFVAGITNGSWGEGQIAAMAMAICCQGMDATERTALTLAMTRSGDQIKWQDFGLEGPFLDKHSTGGVGDKVSLLVAPIIAACGGMMPKMSGRGLGHTGGTVDKLEAIPGYQTAPSQEQFVEVVRQVGCAVIGQTGDLAPADKKFYSIRDVTGTVQSIDLIAASIMSKKLATNPDALMLDVKCGSGAFMATETEAKALAQAMIEIGTQAGVKTAATISDMNQVLGHSAGNALEIQEVMAFLTGERQDTRLKDVVYALCIGLLKMAKLSDTPHQAITQALESGQAAEKFQAMVAGLGGSADFLEKSASYLPPAPIIAPVPAHRSGEILAIETRDLGLAVVGLGGGRRQQTDRIDHRVGLTEVRALGAAVEKGDPLAFVHAHSQESADHAIAAIQAAITVGDKQASVILDVLGGSYYNP